MKKTNTLLLLTLLFVVHAFGQTQLKKWYMSSTEIDLQSTSLISSTLPSGSNIGPSNGMYDTNGNLLFYVNGAVVYDKNGINKGALTYAQISKHNDVMIVPFLNNSRCQNKYYIFYITPYYSSPSSGSIESYLHIGFVDVSTTTGDITFSNLSVNSTIPTATPTSPLISVGSFGGSLAVSDVRNGKRFLYVANGNDFFTSVHKIEITSPDPSSTSGYGKYGIGAPSLLFKSTTEAGTPKEFDLSRDGMKLAISSTGLDPGQTYYRPLFRVINLNTSGNFSSSSTFSLPVSIFNYDIVGAEFNDNGTKLFVSSGGNGSSDPLRGIYVRDLISNTTSSIIPGSQSYSNSQIERGYNGLIYAANSSTIQGINPNTMQLTTSVLTTVTQIAGGTSNIHGYLLPDQIDGCNYDNYLYESINYSTQPTLLTPGTWTPSSNPFNNNSSVIYIKNDINLTVPGTYNMNSMNFEFGKDVQVNVGSGVTLNIAASSLKGVDCGVMWKGINIQSGGELNINNSSVPTNKSYIYDAYTAIQSSSANISLTVKNTEFERNEKHIILDNCPGIPFITIEGNRFLHTVPLKDQTRGVASVSDNKNYGIRSIGIFNMTSGSNCSISYNEFYGGKQGVSVYKSSVNINNCHFQSLGNYLEVAIAANQMSTNSPIEVSKCTFHSINTAFAVTLGNVIKFNENTINTTTNNAVDLFNNNNASIEISKNTFTGCRHNAVALLNNGGPSSSAKIISNTINGIGAKVPNVGISITETSGPKTSPSFGNPSEGLFVEDNIMNNVSYGIVTNGVTGEQNNSSTPKGLSYIDRNKITFSSTVVAYGNASDYNTGIHLIYSNQMRSVSNTINTSNNKSWRNRGIFSEWTTSTLIKSNEIKAGRGISAICNAMNNNYTCNTFNANVNGISLGDHWMRNVGDFHGIKNIESRDNTYLASTARDIELYANPLLNPNGSISVSAANRIKVFVPACQWYFNSAPGIDIIPAWGTNTIDAGPAPDLCGVELILPPDTISYSDETVFPDGETVNNWEWAYRYERERKKKGLPFYNLIIRTIIDLQDEIAVGNYGNAQNLLTGLSSQNEIEQHFIDVYSIFINSQLPEYRLLNEEEQVIMNQIASLNPQQAGPAVYIARGIVWHQFGRQYSNETDRYASAAVTFNYECFENFPFESISGYIVTEDGTIYPDAQVEISEEGFAYLPGYILENLPDGNTYAFVFDLNGSTYTTSYLSKVEWPLAIDQQVNLCEQGVVGKRTSVLTKESKVIVRIYPNPSTGVVHIENNNSEKISIQVIDMRGQQIENKEIIGEYQLDLSNEINGLYFIRVINKDGNLIQARSILLNK